MALRKGDVVVYKHPIKGLYGSLGIVTALPGDYPSYCNGPLGRFSYAVEIAGYHYEVEEDYVEVIDHDEELLKNPDELVTFGCLGIHLEDHAATVKGAKVLKLPKPAPSDLTGIPMNRWSPGDGVISWKRAHRPDMITVEESNQPACSYVRANILRLGHKNYKVALFQGKGHRDTIYKTNRWMNVRETVGNHLCDIDRYLERPLTKWRLPTEEECFAPQRGDVVVIKGDGRNDLYYHEGGIGLVLDTNDPQQPGRCQVRIEGGDNGWVVLKNDEIEVIDHDEDLLKEPDPVEDVPPEESQGDETLPISTEILHTLFQVENDGYSWAIAHVLNEKELCLVRTCRHCTEKKAIRLVDIKF